MYHDRQRLAALWQTELDLFRAEHPASEREFERAVQHMPDGVPMLWMVPSLIAMADSVRILKFASTVRMAPATMTRSHGVLTTGVGGGAAVPAGFAFWARSGRAAARSAAAARVRTKRGRRIKRVLRTRKRKAGDPSSGSS